MGSITLCRKPSSYELRAICAVTGCCRASVLAFLRVRNPSTSTRRQILKVLREIGLVVDSAQDPEIQALLKSLDAIERLTGGGFGSGWDARKVPAPSEP